MIHIPTPRATDAQLYEAITDVIHDAIHGRRCGRSDKLTGANHATCVECRRWDDDVPPDQLRHRVAAAAQAQLRTRGLDYAPTDLIIILDYRVYDVALGSLALLHSAWLHRDDRRDDGLADFDQIVRELQEVRAAQGANLTLAEIAQFEQAHADREAARPLIEAMTYMTEEIERRERPTSWDRLMRDDA